jgi:hypothetical protein
MLRGVSEGHRLGEDQILGIFKNLDPVALNESIHTEELL